MTQNLINAINKSKKIKMSVRYIGSRSYLVITPQAHEYVVRFEKDRLFRALVLPTLTSGLEWTRVGVNLRSDGLRELAIA